MAIRIKKNELYREIDLLVDDVKVGEAEVEIINNMLSRFVIFEPYQNKGYGTQFLELLVRDYEIDNLWVRSDNARAIHVYEKCGFARSKETMFEMQCHFK